jgi:hypothetical protein
MISSVLKLIPIIDLDAPFPSYDEGSAISTSLPTQTESFSNPVHYRGTVVWLGWPKDSTDVSVYVFDGATLSRFTISPNAGASTWGSAYDKVTPTIGGHLFAHDEQLFYAPRGLFGEDPVFVHNHFFKIDIQPTFATYVTIDTGFNVTEQYNLQNPWAPGGSGSALPALGNFHGFNRGILTAGSHLGKIHVLNVDGTLSRLDNSTYVRTACFDLRDAPGMLATSLEPVLASLYGKSFRLNSMESLSPDSTDSLQYLGGRVDVSVGAHVGSKGTLRALWSDGTPVELGIQSLDGSDNFPALLTGEKIDVRYGFAGTLRRDDPTLWNEGSPAAALMLSHEKYLYIITGVQGPAKTGTESHLHAPLMVTRWSGLLPSDPGYSASNDAPTFMIIGDGGSQANVAGLDAYIDDDTGVLHLLWGDLTVKSVKHVQIDLLRFAQLGTVAVHTLPSNGYPGAVKPGDLFGFVIFEPQVEQIAYPTYNPATKTARINYKIYSAFPGGLLKIVNMIVEFNAGNGWKPATPKSTDPDHSGVTKLSADIEGGSEGYVFVHDVYADLPGYTGPLQYRLTAVVP